MIKNNTLNLLQKAIQHAIALDSSLPKKLEVLDGKTVEIIITPLNIRFFMCFVQQEIQLHSHCSTAPDVAIESSPLGFIRLSILPASKVRSLFNDGVKISGDVELGQQIKQLFDSIDIDWEGHLARFTGDVAAYQLGSLFRKGIAFQGRLKTSIHRNITDYLQEELRCFPGQEEINDFFNDVDELSLRVERLAAKHKAAYP